MKNITTFFSIFFIVIICTSSFAQSIQDDFEGTGNISTWAGDECQLDINFNNPVMDGINNSAKILRYQDDGGQYANVRFDVGQNFNLIDNNIFTFKIYVPSAGLTGTQNNQVSLKLQDGTSATPWSTQSEIIKNITLDQWQTISFNFASDPYINLDPSSPAPILRTDFNRVVIQVNGENNTDEVLAYLDDFNYIDAGPGPGSNFTELVWSDEFNGTGEINSSNWFHQTQIPAGGSWYNGEIQHYTNRTENTSEGNGNLNLIAQKETFTDQGFTKQYTSARLNSKFAFTYGKVEVRAKLPEGVGTWPAIWMLGKNINESGAYFETQGFGITSWPACGEIDIMEHWGGNQNFVQSAMHTPSSSGATVNHGGQTIPTASSDFHIYTLEWSQEKMEFSIDGNIHYIYNPAIKNASTWPFDNDQYILLNIAIQPSIAASFVQDTMVIDYVRVYQEPSTALSSHQIETPVYFPNPVSDKLTIEMADVSDKSINVNIYSIHGSLLKNYKVSTNQNLINISGLAKLAKGFYLLTYTIEEKNYMLKFIKS